MLTQPDKMKNLEVKKTFDAFLKKSKTVNKFL